jgi:hypothetical protein
MKRFFKILGIILILFIAGVVLFPILFKDEIISRAKAELNNQLEAEVDFADISLSIFRTFPDFNLGIENLTVDGKGAFAGKRLASIGDFNVELNVYSVIQGDKFEIEGIRIADADIHVIVDKAGNANYDVTKASEATEEASVDTTTSGFLLKLNAFEISNMNLIYDDQEGGMKAVLKNLNFNASGDLSEELVALKTNTTIDDLTFRMDGVDYMSHTKAFADMDFEFDQPKFKLTLKENTLGLNDLRLNMDGFVALPTDDIEMDLNFNAPQSDFKSVLSMVPAIYMEGFESVKTTGTFSLNGMLKGVFNSEKEVYPAFNFDFLVQDGTFRYPDLPAGVNGINVEMHIKNPSNTLDATVVDIPKASAKIAGSPFSANMRLATPMSDPQFKGNLQTKLDLQNLSKVVPSSDFDYTGKIDADVRFAGKMSDVDNENYDAVDVAGNVSVTDVVLRSDSLPFDVKVTTAKMEFSPQQLLLPELNMQVGESDFSADGSVDNLLAYALEDSVLHARFNFSSSYININELMGAAPSGSETESTESTSEESLEVVRLPENIDFALNSNITKVLYDNLEIENLKGMVTLSKGVAGLKDISMDLLDGQIAMDGAYNSVPNAPEADFNIKINNFSFKETYANFVSFEKLAPIMKDAVGSFSTGFSFKSKLNSDMSPDLSTLMADGALQTKGLSVSTKSLKQLSNILQNPSLSSLDLGRVNVSFQVQDGRVDVKPFDFSAGNVNATVSGSSGLDQSLDYTMDLKVPVKGIGASDILNQLGASQNGKVDVAVLIGGTFSNPTVKTSLGNIVGNVIDNLKDKAKEKVEEVKQDAIDKANEEAQKLIDAAEAQGDKLIVEAEKQAENIRALAKTQADKIRTEGEKKASELQEAAKGNILKEQGAKLAADKLRKEAAEKANTVEREADKRASALVDKARAQKEELVEQARAKGQING